MKKIDYVVKDALGIHARPAGVLAKTTMQFESTIVLESKGKIVNATKIMAILSMGIKCGDEVVVTIDGKDEENAYKALKELFEKQL